MTVQISQAPEVEEASGIAHLFRLLADTTRMRLLYALLEAGELCVSDLSTTIDAEESTVSHALSVLRQAGVVKNRKSGRTVYYSLDDSHVRMLLDLTREHLRH